MLWKGYGGWHIQTESFHLLNLSSGRTWVGKVLILQQILGEYNLWSFEMMLRLFHPLLLIFSSLLYFFVEVVDLFHWKILSSLPRHIRFVSFSYVLIFSLLLLGALSFLLCSIPDSLIWHIVINVIIFVCMETQMPYKIQIENHGIELLH